jgi:hypothetical protein
MMIEQRHVEEFPTSGVKYLGRERKDKHGRKKNRCWRDKLLSGEYMRTLRNSVEYEHQSSICDAIPLEP